MGAETAALLRPSVCVGTCVCVSCTRNNIFGYLKTEKRPVSGSVCVPRLYECLRPPHRLWQFYANHKKDCPSPQLTG